MLAPFYIGSLDVPRKTGGGRESCRRKGVVHGIATLTALRGFIRGVLARPPQACGSPCHIGA